jgi:hypothetical protein
VQHLGRRLRVAELRRRPRRHPRWLARVPSGGRWWRCS